MSETILKIKSVFDATGAKQASSAMKKLADTLDSMKSTTKKTNGIFSNFFGSLTRIAKLRLLRGIIRSITSAFKEGTENLYRYSQAMGAADASHFANTMDSLATSLLYMKNSIGAVVAPLLAQLLPTIQWIINAFVTATQVVAQFFAALGGQVMYTRAKESATVWKDVQTSAGGAAAAAKEYKNTILSFDEIHALNDVPTSGGGGGGGASTPDYSDMFEEANISPKIREFVEWLKENWKDILEIVGAIGIAMLGWKIANGVTSFFEGLGLLGGNAAAVKELGLGLVLMVTGVTLSAVGGYSIGYEGTDLMNIIKTALGIGLGAAGGALAAHAITALGIASVGTGVGAVFGIGIALVGTIIGFTIGEGKAQREAIVADLEEYTGQINNIINKQNTYVEVSRQAWSDYDTTLSNLAYAEYLTNQLDVLSQKQQLSNSETEIAKVLIDELNGLGLEGITAAWDDETQRIQINTQEIYNNIDAIKEKARTKALEDILIAKYKDEAEAMLDMTQAQDLVEEAQKNYNDKLAQYQPLADAMGISLEELAQRHGFESIYLSKEKYALGQAQLALESATSRHNDATKAIDDTSQALWGESSAAESAKNATNDATSATKNMGGVSIGSGLANSIWNVANAASSAAYNAWDSFNALNHLKGLGGTISIGVNVVSSIARNALGFANGGFVNGYANGGIIPRFDGGGINSADLFLARENGSPELVGRIGNRTAVANQQQMVDVLANGVMQAVASAGGGQTSNLEVNVLMDREVLAKAVDRGNRSLNRRYSVALS